MILWTWTAALSGFVLFPLFAPESNAIIPFATIILGLLLYTLFHPGLRIERRNKRKRDARCQGGRRLPEPRAALTHGRSDRDGCCGCRRVAAGERVRVGTNGASGLAAERDTGPTPETALN